MASGMPIRELVVVSGKGGTGKTSLVAAFAALAGSAVVADCDVDAADLHLVLAPEVQRRETFSAGHEAVIRQSDCTGCGVCAARCRFEAIRTGRTGGAEPEYTVDPFVCEGCGVCVWSCPAKAVEFTPRRSGEWYLSETRHGPLVHARLGIAEENSGKLVAVVRRKAARAAVERGLDLVITDGPPGIGCPVIAAIGGATAVLAVAEPTVSGLHDLQRVVGLARHFGVPVLICVNKHDIAPEMTASVLAYGAAEGIEVVGRIPYDPAVTRAQLAATSIVEYGNSPAADAVKAVWRCVRSRLEN